MKITNIQKLNYTRISFCAGQTKLYTDFDGTYFPFSQDVIEQKQEPYCSLLNNMYTLFDNFKKIAKEHFFTVVTTGRSKLEMKTAKNEIANAGILFPQVESYILRNGLEEHKDIGNNLNASMPFSENSTRNSIENIVKNIDKNVKILHSSTNKSIQNDYLNSFEALYEKLPPSKRKKYISMVTEDNGFVELMFSPYINPKQYFNSLSEYIKTIDYNMKLPCCKTIKVFGYHHQMIHKKNGKRQMS